MNKLFNTKNEKENFKLLLSIFQNAVDGIITINGNGIIQAANPAITRIFGYNSEEILNKNIKMLMPEPYKGEHDRHIKNYQNHGISKIIGKDREVKGRRKDGSVFDFNLMMSEVKFTGSRNYVGIIRDVSKDKQKDKELVSTRNQFKAVFENAVDGMIIISNRGLIRMANPAVINLFQYELSEILNKNIKMLMPEPYHSEHDGYLHNYQSTRTAKIIGIGREVKGRKKDGTVFPFSLGVSEVIVGDDVMYAGVIHDLTDQKKREVEIQELNLELEKKVKTRTEELSEVVNKLLKTNSLYELEIKQRTEIQEALAQSEGELRVALGKEKELGELKSRFVSMASHEFRTPLSTILSSVSLIERYRKDEQIEKREKHIHRIKDSVKNLTGILNDFLSLSKLEEGKVTINKSRFLWKDYIDTLVEEFTPKLKENQKIIHSYEDEALEVTSDTHLLTNIFNNICSNAIKYSMAGSTIYCNQKVVGKRLVIEIKDEGLGIPQAEQKHMFSRFYRATNVSNIQGTGLGLTIVKRYVDLLGGEISFSSTEGKGTTFTINLPLK